MEDYGSVEQGDQETQRQRYEARMAAIRQEFVAQPQRLTAGTHAVRARADAVDALVRELWLESAGSDPLLVSSVAIVAVGGFGRQELFPYSDVDLMFLLKTAEAERTVQDAIRQLSQALWDAGVRVSPMTRTLEECRRFDPENVEFTLALLDARHVAGDSGLCAKLCGEAVPHVVAKERKRCIKRLLQVTTTRHARYGGTLFHLEPNVKDCPGGLRDAHVSAWLARLSARGEGLALPLGDEFLEAREFMLLIRAFLHFRHGRDDNTLDWQAQDGAAAARLGLLHSGSAKQEVDPAFWMRIYFRHARAIERKITQSMEEFSSAAPASTPVPVTGVRRPHGAMGHAGFEVRQGRIVLSTAAGRADYDPAHDPEVVFAVFAAMARTGARLPRAAEARLEDALPILSSQIEDGPGLWLHLQAILTAPFAGRALRAMHALGILELVIPEFHGIDALVIRDAYHRYTVDEHTFVLIDTLHGLRADTACATPWAARFAIVLRDLPHLELLMLAALLHDTGKGHAAAAHAVESARMARNVLARLEVDAYESGLVLDLIVQHLEMSAALRRDVFDQETIRSFATRVPTPEALRMLTLFTYADIAAVHPDALTPWKAENLWRLYMATSNFLDRSVDDERVASIAASEQSEAMHRVQALLGGREKEVQRFLEGLPRRYLLTRTPDHIRAHVEMASRLTETGPLADQLDFRYAAGLSELTLITHDRAKLFARLAGALAAWQMNIVTADAFSNAHGVVVDSFRFTDTCRTLELNLSERERFVESVRDLMSGKANVEPMLVARRRGRRPAPKVVVEPRVDFDDKASTQSTLLQVVAQDTPGLLRALSLTLAEQGCSIEVALVDTEGEMAIDVFYVTDAGLKLVPQKQEQVRTSLFAAIAANAT